MKPQYYICLLLCFIAFFYSSCRSTKFVPDGKYLLVNTKVESDTKGVNSTTAGSYIRQKPNFKTFTVFKFPLFLYNLSGRDSTKWVNKTLRNAGEPPVIYDSLAVERTTTDLARMMTNMGYLNAQVTPIVDLKAKKADVTYKIEGGNPYKINKYSILLDDSVISKPDTLFITGIRKLGSSVYAGQIDSLVYRNQLVSKNSIFDLNVLDQERERVTKLLRRSGYYAMNKEYVGFVADTLVGSQQVGLDLILYPYAQRDQVGGVIESPHRQYIVESVELYIDYNPVLYGDISEYMPVKVYERDGYIIKYGERGQYIKPHIILSNCFIRPGSLYNESLTAHTYAALSQLKILKNVNISYNLVGENLRCIITCVPDKRQGISTELEGTNSGGFFGVGAGVGYMHRNAFRGSEVFNIGLKGAYEAVTPNFTNFDENYFEIGAETSLTFPSFMFPFLKRDFRKSIQASTQFNAGYTFQRRPGFFTRTVLSSGIKYIWNDRLQTGKRHVFDLVDVSYIHLPPAQLDSAFHANLSQGARKYSFSDQFIMSTGYTFTKTNANLPNRRTRPIYSIRASVETAGNLLSLAAKLAGEKRNKEGSRELFGTQFAQYARATFDYSRTFIIDERNSFAWHAGTGLAYPYGNFKEVPIQKRFFSGGGNSVRGWAVRELGPGSFYPTDKKKYDNFYYHSGDIRLDMNIEFRSKLFWLLELGAFVDAGNIWTTKNYDQQEGGRMKLDTFYKEIALAWGLGFRFDFNFVLLRLDCGWKAYDPSGDPNKTKWPIKHPHKLRKNTALHIAVGYPF